MNDKILYHLATDKFDIEARTYAQNFIFGFNIEGRPNGLWCSYGKSWLNALRKETSPVYRPCCFLYQVNGPQPREINDPAELVREFPTYFLNIDYYHIKFTDKLNDRLIDIKPRHQLSEIYHTIVHDAKKYGLYESLLRNHLIFEDIEMARRHCHNYADMDDTIERFRYIDWNRVPSPMLFNYDAVNPKHNYYFWYQSLDITSCCFWEIKDITINLAEDV